jgi:hypothetical protein
MENTSDRAEKLEVVQENYDSPRIQNLSENGFNNCLCIKRLEIFYPLRRAPTNFDWNPKFVR